MKKLVIVLLAIVMVGAVSVPTASAFHAWWHWGWGPVYPPYSPPPAPIYVPPSRTCYTEPGHWSEVPYTNDLGFTTYQRVWVPERTVCS